MVAKAIMIGNLGNTPELRYAQSGTAVCNLRLAVNSRGKGGVDETDWFDVACFGRTAEAVAQYCDKGERLARKDLVEDVVCAGCGGCDGHGSVHFFAAAAAASRIRCQVV